MAKKPHPRLVFAAPRGNRCHMIIATTILPFYVCLEALAFASDPSPASTMQAAETVQSDVKPEVLKTQIASPTEAVRPAPELDAAPVIELAQAELSPLSPPVEIKSDTPQANELGSPIEAEPDISEAPAPEAANTPQSAEAETPIAPEMPIQDILKNIDARMSESETAKGGFVQTDALGDVTTGEFYIKRPGKVRFEYNPPAPYLIVSDGTTIAIEDKDLETVDRAPLGATPLKHFLKRNLSLAQDATILDVRTLDDAHLVILEDNPQNGDEAMEGILFLKFAKDTFDLTGWVTLDGLGNETRVDLVDMEFNKKIPARYFILEDEDDRDR
jgi:outer membrane lipoprotein-sorting protein